VERQTGRHEEASSLFSSDLRTLPTREYNIHT